MLHATETGISSCYKVETLYSSTKLSTGSLCEHVCVGSLAIYPQFRNSEHVLDFFFNMNIFQIGYRVSEHSTILCRYPGTSARHQV